jgi:hypothetical protein
VVSGTLRGRATLGLADQQQAKRHLTRTALEIVFHGQNAANFRQGFDALISPAHQLLDLSDGLAALGDQYPTPDAPERTPSRFDFAALDNEVMTPHMSGWTAGTARRRQETMADNIARLLAGQPLLNVLKA